METKYPTLRRPKRKLCYHSDKERPTKQWTGMISLGDIDRMFDDLEPSDHEEDVVLPASPLLHIDDTEPNQIEAGPSPLQQQDSHSSEAPQKCLKSPNRCSNDVSLSPQKDIDLECLVQGPAKTSSPIEGNKGVDVGCNDKKDVAISPVLFLGENDDEEQPQSQPIVSPKCISSKSDPFIEKASRKAELESRTTVSRHENTQSSGKMLTNKPKEATLKTNVKIPRQAEKSMPTFLQKLRDGSQSAHSWKPVSPVKAPTAPEEDFFILEDDVPLLFCIPRTASSNTKHNVTSGNQINTPTGNGSPEKLCPPVDHSVDGRLVHQKPIKKQSRVKQVSFEKSDTSVKPQDTTRKATNIEESSGKMMKKAKSVKLDKERSKEKTRKKGARVVKEMLHVEAGIGENSDNDEHGRADDPALASGDEFRNGEASKTKSEQSSSTESGKRQRRPPGQWWVSSALSTEGADVSEHQPTAKKPKQRNAESVQSPAKRKKDQNLERLKKKEPVLSSSQKTNQAREKKPKRNKSGEQLRANPRKTKALQKVFVETEQELLDSGPLSTSPLPLAPRGHGTSPGYKAGQRASHRLSTEKICTPASTSARVSLEQLQETHSDKRRRKPPCDWWVVGNQVDNVSPLPQPQQVKPVRGRKKAKQNKTLGLGSPKNGNVAVSSKPPGGAQDPSHRVKGALAKKAVKRSLAPFMDSFPTAVETPSKASRKVTGLCSKQEDSARDSSPHRMPEAQDASRTDAGDPNREWEHPNDISHSDNTSGLIRSGPSSIIQLIDYQDNDASLPSSRVSALLSVSDLCAPPLQPLVLQPKDKGNLSEWFRSAWSDGGADVTPDQFDWYFYQGRALGIHVDLNSGSFCNGKMLLGSYMKKPLWVDHCATTVFNVLTSSVNVVINGSESRFHPAQAFVVPCGHAYSIQNVSAKPAMLYFTRMFSESSD